MSTATTAAASPLALAPTWENAERTFQTTAFQEQVLPAYVRDRRWFSGKAHHLARIEVVALLPLHTPEAGRLALLRADFADAPAEHYLLPLQLVAASADPRSELLRFSVGGEEGALIDAVEDESFRSALFRLMREEQRVVTPAGTLIGISGPALRAAAATLPEPLPSRPVAAEQSNTSLLYDGRFFLKLYRRPGEGQNPDAELLRFLSERQHFPHVPAFCGAIEWQPPASASRVLGLLVANVPNLGDAWSFTLAALAEFYARVQRAPAAIDGASDGEFERLLGGDFPARARLLGVRTAQMHLALAADLDDPDFAPEPFTETAQRTLVATMTAGTRRMCHLLAQGIVGLPDRTREEAVALLARESEILRRQQRLLERPLHATRIRHHGDYHLGQVLTTADDFVILDFEGEPARPLVERRAKRTPLRDVAGMLRSFHYAAHAALGQAQAGNGAAESLLVPWAEHWARHIGAAFLESYLATADGASFLPKSPAACSLLLDACLLEKATYEVCYELNQRPDWALIPLRGITSILATAEPV